MDRAESRPFGCGYASVPLRSEIVVSSNDVPSPIFISYSHDSLNYMETVLGIANRLRKDHFDASIDQYETSPPEGWPAWMAKQVSSSRFVLVCCTEPYSRRLLGQEVPGKGLGSTWEGLHITQEVYESLGRNEKFIPVVFSESDTKHIPVFLRGATHYNLSLNEDYLRLVRHLQGQAPALRPPIGRPQVRSVDADTATTPRVAPLVPQADPEPMNLVLVLAESSDGSGVVVPASRIEMRPEEVRFTLSATEPAATALFSSLQLKLGASIAVAFKLTALVGKVVECNRALTEGAEEWALTVHRLHRGLGIESEMAFDSLSADQIAEIRARLVLLAEPIKSPSPDPMNRAMLMAIVSGINAPVQVSASPFPSLFRSLPDSPQRALAIAKLFSVAMLVLTDTVEHILRFDVAFANGELTVDFAGRRPQRSVNASPGVIDVSGRCDLSAD